LQINIRVKKLMLQFPTERIQGRSRGDQTRVEFDSTHSLKIAIVVMTNRNIGVTRPDINGCEKKSV